MSATPSCAPAATSGRRFEANADNPCHPCARGGRPRIPAHWSGAARAGLQHADGGDDVVIDFLPLHMRSSVPALMVRFSTSRLRSGRAAWRRARLRHWRARGNGADAVLIFRHAGFATGVAAPQELEPFSSGSANSWTHACARADSAAVLLSASCSSADGCVALRSRNARLKSKGDAIRKWFPVPWPCPPRARAW